MNNSDSEDDYDENETISTKFEEGCTDGMIKVNVSRIGDVGGHPIYEVHRNFAFVKIRNNAATNLINKLGTYL